MVWKVHFSIDDVLGTLRWCAQHQPPSIFSMDFFGTLAKWHGLYGLKCNLYAFYSDGDGFDLSQVPHRYIEELLRQKDWLLLSYHGIVTRGDYQDDPERFEREWRQTLRIFPSEDRPHMTRFHCWEMPQSLRERLRARGVFGLLCPPRGGKTSYGMDAASAQALEDAGTVQQDGTLFWRTDVRWDFLTLDECRTAAREEQAALGGARPLTVFGHEWRFAQQREMLEAFLSSLPETEWVF